ncbi:EEF1A lysine methyltransferase 2 isoform X2 [Electrophorus electricus]|uniref:EEF1A lysine methyltransferase 2 isoform X2 n=1 Tax=Electrophorus electricus TaxID=8005 RepID=UPI0015D00DBF|nr:EEF1A lysine methyltransferase 2 isoform X2 [Electrophorus electricus]
MASTENTHAQNNSSAPCVEDDFTPSALGTKEYWDNAYRRELETYKDIGDVGEIWFGEGSMRRVIQWMQKQNIPLHVAILDIGMGNGVFLVELAKQGFTNLTGIDYSIASVELTRSILEGEDLTDIKVQVLLTNKSISIGTKRGPSYANLFVECIEKHCFEQYIGHVLLQFLRYTDDIFGIATCTLEDLKHHSVILQVSPSF